MSFLLNKLDEYRISNIAVLVKCLTGKEIRKESTRSTLNNHIYRLIRIQPIVIGPALRAYCIDVQRRVTYGYIFIVHRNLSIRCYGKEKLTLTIVILFGNFLLSVGVRLHSNWYIYIYISLYYATEESNLRYSERRRWAVTLRKQWFKRTTWTTKQRILKVTV